MSNTDNFKLPYLAAGQAQKHVTLNESLRALDALVHLCLQSRVLATPPTAPDAGARYLIPGAATGVWSGKAGQIAAWQDGAWAYFTPQAGWRAFVVAEAALILFTGTEWRVETTTITMLDRLGINASASTTNRLTVKSSVSLFDQDGGNHRVVINKAAAGNTASTLFQTNYSGRAEFGLTGSDDFQLKTSPDGAAWTNVLSFDKTTGLGIVKADPITALGIATKQYVDAQSTSNAALPAGAIAHFAMATPPNGWLKANGAAISRSSYAALFAAIGTQYGAGNGTSTFNLPDLRGEFLRGWDDGRNVDAGRALGSTQSDDIKSHTHAGVIGTATNTNIGTGAGVVAPVGNAALGATGGAETRPRNVALLVCIKA